MAKIRKVESNAKFRQCLPKDLNDFKDFNDLKGLNRRQAEQKPAFAFLRVTHPLNPPPVRGTYRGANRRSQREQKLLAGYAEQGGGKNA